MADKKCLSLAACSAASLSQAAEIGSGLSSPLAEDEEPELCCR
eukprot:CAMPEP_0202413620 /NCGR_PEP_ID=MMETSP1128-20130828/30065_1 /ASSEMBLY_ACC=CAM_ASM_000463 /TAXON_ID=3047 /ORGANISM="Dunaliella tertiolecta, Strain CCMP1320" /LENGTH=42 /DNA_ID= /DNA_START= /DNA_END= /DNA_ORIENTATION=